LVSFALVALLMWVTPRLHAQTVSGTILGTVQDQQGAVVAKAEVTARNLDNGSVRKAASNDFGNYRIDSVPAGPYEVSSSAAGFKTEVRSGIVVTVGSDVGVNFSLTIGAISEKVEVTGDAPQVDTSSSALGGFVNSATIRELPLNGRGWLQLALLQPGANLNPGLHYGREDAL
jgi:Carboxypeptidase regulatory-like domain